MSLRAAAADGAQLAAAEDGVKFSQKQEVTDAGSAEKTKEKRESIACVGADQQQLISACQQRQQVACGKGQEANNNSIACLEEQAALGSWHETSSSAPAVALVVCSSDRPSSGAAAAEAERREEQQQEEGERAGEAYAKMSRASTFGGAPKGNSGNAREEEANEEEEEEKAIGKERAREAASERQHTVIELSDSQVHLSAAPDSHHNSQSSDKTPSDTTPTQLNHSRLDLAHTNQEEEDRSKRCSAASSQRTSSPRFAESEDGQEKGQDRRQTTLVAAQQQAHQREEEPIQLELYKRTRRLSFLQSLLLRKWPYLALAICVACSLAVGMLLSALTVYFMHALVAGQCLPSAAAGSEWQAAPLEPPVAPPLVVSATSAAGGELASGEPPLLGRSHLSSTAAVAATSQPQSSAEQRPAQFQRLPATLFPDHYELFIWPHLDRFTFDGRVKILLECRTPTDNITMHAFDLVVDATSVRLEEAPRLANVSAAHSHRRRAASEASNRLAAAPKLHQVTQDAQLQHLVLGLEAPLEAGRKYELTMDFTGRLNDDLAGFYKIKYERQNSTEPIWIAATQFQATDARRAFPCFDEPLYKATFSIKIKHWRNMTALSNMPIVSSEVSPDGLWVSDSFAKSHRMSTYLVAFAVTNFESRSEGNISVWTRPGFVHTAEYALKIAGRILRHYEQFFGIEYPLPKMDMIALPDFNAGAMENWGLITYRETAMLYDESSSSVANKQRVAVVVAHELAHQWFGNLVTPKWWDDLWLNEGFASFVEYIGVDHVEPKWRMLDQFVVEEVQNVFKVDSLSSSHQISIPVNNPDEISEIFDHISYAKGASIIRMMSHFLTEDVFKLGLRRYLRALKYSNAEQSDLWAHLTEAQRSLASSSSSSGSEMVNVERVMNSWTLQTGYPLVTVSRRYSNESGAAGGALLEQVRYQPYKLMQQQNGTNVAPTNGSATPLTALQKWEIPITYTWSSDQNWAPRTRLWLHQNSSGPVEISATLLPVEDHDWLIVNLNQVGYYRVNYDLRNWKLLIKQLLEDHKKIGTTNRAQMLDDMFELAKSSILDYNFAMEATRYLKSEREYLPWDTVLLAFSYIDDMLQRTPIYGDWTDYIADLIEPYYGRYKNLQWTVTRRPEQGGNASEVTSPAPIDSNDVLEQYNRVNAVAWACQVNEHCIKKAKQVFKEWRQSGTNDINPALRYTVYCTSIENGDKEDWAFLWRAYEREQNASERDRIMRALSCSKEMWILSRYLEWIFNKNKPIRRQDGAYVFRMIAKNNYGRDIAFNFMRERWSTIKEFYGKTSFSLGNLIRSISTSMNTQVELDQLRLFYENIKADVGTGKRSFQIAIEEVESNVHWRNRNYKILEQWLHKEKETTTTVAVAAPA